MEKKDTISVIVPVYKVESYLRQCIDSILAQTYRDFQLILVDDGSPDSCGEICEEYAVKDSRILVIHQENGGVSAARNAGIDWVFANSDSRWLNFIDSDDEVSPRYLENLYRYAVESGADITLTNAYWFSDDSELAYAPDGVAGVRTISGRDGCRECLNGSQVIGWAWGALYRRELFEQLRFPVGRIFEDAAVMPVLLYQSEKVTILRAGLYRYRQREGSIINSPISYKRFDFVWGFDGHITYFRARGERELARLAKNRRDMEWAELVIRARALNLKDQIPAQYRMPQWKAYYITLVATLRRGGLKFVLVRLGHLYEKIIGKR